MKKLFALMLGILFVANFAMAENLKDAKIKTNASCNDCKAKIEKSLKEIKGVKTASVDMKAKEVTVKYDADLTNEQALNAAVAAGCTATKEGKCDGKCKDAKKDAKCDSKCKETKCKEAKTEPKTETKTDSKCGSKCSSKCKGSK